MISSAQSDELADRNSRIEAQPISSQKCPECGAEIPVYQGYITWCDHCMWNIAATQVDRPHNFFEVLNLKLGKKLGKEQFEEMARAPELKPTLTPTKIAAFLIAVLVHSLTLLTFLLGVAIIVSLGITVSTIFAIIFLGIAWIMRPRITRLPKDNVISREQYPELYALADRISKALGARPVNIIVLDTRFNASFYQAGWLRKDVLTIGLPLFEILAPQERTALLAHEIGHGVNGDPTRGYVVGTALFALNEWYKVMYPGGRGRHRGKIAFANFLANIVLLGLSQIPKFWINVLALLMFRDHQRAEYLADHLAAEVAGTDGKLGLLRKLHMSDNAEMTIRRFYLNNSKGNIFAAIKAQASNIPQREVARLDQAERLADSRLDTTHPPTVFRIDLLKARPIREPKVVLGELENAAINKELAQAEPEVQSQLLGRLDSASYY